MSNRNPNRFGAISFALFCSSAICVVPAAWAVELQSAYTQALCTLKGYPLASTLKGAIAVPGGSAAGVPAVQDLAVRTLPQEGPEAALEFERSFRGPMDRTTMSPQRAFPSAKPIPLKGLKNIVPITRQMWSRQQVLADFSKNRAQDQVAPIVFVKTELCHKNIYRPCAVTTSVFEKQASPLLKKFRVYGAWIKINPDQTEAEWQEWEEKVVEEYEFDQGPGARIVVLNPKNAEVLGSDASDLELLMQEFEMNNGKVPTLEAELQKILDYLEGRRENL